MCRITITCLFTLATTLMPGMDAQDFTHQTKVYFFEINLVSPTETNPQKNDQTLCNELLDLDTKNDKIHIKAVSVAQDNNVDSILNSFKKYHVQHCCIQQVYDLDVVDNYANHHVEPLKLATLLSDNHHLESLHLIGSKLTIDCEDFSSALKSAHLTDLTLDSLSLSKSDLTNILKAISSTAISRLLLSEIYILDEDVQYPYDIDVIPYLLNGNSRNLRHLHINYKMIPKKSFTDFSDGVKNSNIETLMLLDVPKDAFYAFLEKFEKKVKIDVNKEIEFTNLCVKAEILRNKDQAYVVAYDAQTKTVILKTSL